MSGNRNECISVSGHFFISVLYSCVHNHKGVLYIKKLPELFLTALDSS